MLKIKDPKAVMLSGGPLENVYVFEQLHFHWGENDREGSEDLINNHSFPMEMHAVFYKQEYNTMKEALDHDDGLTVLAYLYEVRELAFSSLSRIAQRRCKSIYPSFRFPEKTLFRDEFV